MKHGLAVKPDERGAAAQLLRLVSVEPAEIVMKLCELVARAAIRRRGSDALAHCRRELTLPQLDQPHGAPAYLASRVVDAVHARAGHNAEDEHGGNQEASTFWQAVRSLPMLAAVFASI